MKKQSGTDKKHELRRQAEKQSREEYTPSLQDIRNMSAEDIQRLFHELHVHQIELDLQNQDLQSAQEELEASQELYFELFDLAPVGYIMVSVRGIIFEANLAAADMLGATRDRLINQRFSRFICKKDHDIYYRHRKKIFRSRSLNTREACELRMLRVDDTEFWSFMEASAVQRVDGTICCRVVISDIDKRKKAEEKLRQSEKRFRLMADGCPFMIWIHDKEGRLNFVNQAHCDFFGTTLQEVGDSDWQPLLHPDDKEDYVREFMAALREKRIFTATSRVRRHDGQWRWIMSCGVPQFTDSDEFVGMVGSSPDITERVQTQQELDRMNDLLQKAVTERDKLFSIIAHDLKSPFIGFLTFIRMLTENIDRLSVEEIQNLGREMKHSAESLYSLLENLLEWSMLQRGLNEYQPASCRLTDVVRENIDLFSTVAQNKDISVQCQVQDSLHIYADMSMLKMVLRNLISNAIKFSENRRTVKVSAEFNGESVRVSVADEGIGMDQGTLDKLFILGRVSSRTGTDGEKGTGLGLILCQEYVRRHGGEIWAHSVPGKGTTFHFTLPPGN